MSATPAEKMAVRRHELLADLADRAEVILKRYGLDSKSALAASDEIVDDLIDNWGGQYITVPKDLKYRHAKRAQQMAAEFDGSNHAELATRHGLSVNAVYRILKRASRATNLKG